MEELDRRRRWIAEHILPLEPYIRRWLRSKTRISCAEIDDLIQDSYARLLKGSSDVRLIRNPKTFFITVVKSTMLDSLRRARIVSFESVADFERFEDEEIPGPEQLVSASQQYQRLSKAVEQLPPRRRAVFELRRFSNLSVAETASALNLSVRTVEVTLRRAQAQLAKTLYEEEALVPKTQGSELRRSARHSRPK